MPRLWRKSGGRFEYLPAQKRKLLAAQRFLHQGRFDTPRKRRALMSRRDKRTTSDGFCKILGLLRYQAVTSEEKEVQGIQILSSKKSMAMWDFRYDPKRLLLCIKDETLKATRST